MFAAVGALILTVRVASYGVVKGSRAFTLIGLLASVSVGIAMAFRARDSIQTAESAFGRALADAERTRDELADVNEDLARANAQIQAVNVAYADLLNLTDEQTHGRCAS
ncbi:MAG: hypothetical protein WKF41_14115 [Gaiellaceae bacterium]